MREKFKSSGIALGGIVLLLLCTSVLSIKYDIELEETKRQIKMDYQRCFTEMVQYVDDLQLSLEKSRFVNDPGQMMRLSGEIYRQASMATGNLALLPLKTEPLEHLNEFLNQVGNYSYALSYKMLEGEAVTDEEYEKLSSLEEYAKNIAASLDGDLEALYNGVLDIRRTAEGASPGGIDKVMGEIETQLHDYPALIYDGPFPRILPTVSRCFYRGHRRLTLLRLWKRWQKLQAGMILRTPGRREAFRRIIFMMRTGCAAWL